jgi:hypothetical protein
MRNLIADIQIAPSGGFKGPGSGLLANPGTNAIGVFSSFLSVIIGVMTIVAVIWTIFTIVTGAIGIISSGGDKQALESAKKRITTGIIGLVVVLFALLIVELVGYFLGLNNILDLNCLMNLINGGDCSTPYYPGQTPGPHPTVQPI